MRKLRVIIIDDEKTVLDALKVFFLSRNFDVLTFNEPIVCPLQENQTDRCDKENLCADILITDFKMPRMNGIGLLQSQSQRECPLDIRNKAVISAHMDKKYEKLIKDLDCAFFRKPFNLSELSDWIDKCKKRVDLSRPLGFIKS